MDYDYPYNPPPTQSSYDAAMALQRQPPITSDVQGMPPPPTTAPAMPPPTLVDPEMQRKKVALALQLQQGMAQPTSGTGQGRFATGSSWAQDLNKALNQGMQAYNQFKKTPGKTNPMEMTPRAPTEMPPPASPGYGPGE